MTRGRRCVGPFCAVVLGTSFLALAASGRSASAQQAADAADQVHIRARQRMIAHQKRVDVVAAKLIAALPTAGGRDHVAYVGLRVADHRAKTNVLLARAVGLDEPRRPFVYSVDPTGPAAAAGLQPGDEVVSVGGREIRDSRSYYKRVQRQDLSFPLPVGVLREGTPMELTMDQASRPPGLEVRVAGDPHTVYAYADKHEIVLSTRMITFLRNDSELAVVLGHEMAHVVRGHLSTSYRQGALMPYFSQGLEIEADREGLELAYRAGYDPAVGVDVWERFETELPRAIGDQWLLSHPPARQRIASARRTAEQLRARGAAAAAPAASAESGSP